MFPSKYRLNTRCFKKLLKQSNVYRGDFTKVLYKPSGVFSCAVVVPKRVAKSSVLRHRIKRMFSNKLLGFLAKPYPDMSVAFFIQKDISLGTDKDFRKEIENILNKLV